MKPPTISDLAAIAANYGLHLHDDELAIHAEFIRGFAPSYDAVERLHEQLWPVPPTDRQHSWPSPEENPFGAWYVKTVVPQVDGASDGPLDGVRIALKDNIWLAAVPMMIGSKLVEGFVPSLDATVVTRILRAGATIEGKAVCEDLCLSAASHTAANGPVVNPWNPERTSGGSSSGAAVLVATGEVDAAIGGDQAGSIRVPSAFCGVIGHKPTRGRVPYTGIAGFDATLDHVGPIALRVDVAARMLDVLSGADGVDPRQWRLGPCEPVQERLHDGVEGLRIGLLREGFEIPSMSDPAVDAAVRAAADALAERGAIVREVSVPIHQDGMHVLIVLTLDAGTQPMIDGNGFAPNSTALYDPEFIEHFGRRRREHGEWLSDTVKLALLGGVHSANVEHGRYRAMAQNVASLFRKAYDSVLSADVDALVLPTVPSTAPLLTSPDADKASYIANAFYGIANTCPFDISGHPALTVPAGLVDGLPVGMMVVGRYGDDVTCFRIAQAYEEAVGGFTPARAS